MKKLVLFAVLVAMVFATSTAMAQMKYPMGLGNVALKVDYFRFTENDFEDLGAEDGLYLGLEGYMSVFMPNFYLGLETGWAMTDGKEDFIFPGVGLREVDTDIDYVPIEFNAKYVVDLHPCWTWDFGAGISANYIDMEFDVNRVGLLNDFDTDDWLFGGQFFTSINYKYCNWFFGINAKYQITDDIEIDGPRGSDIDTDVSADNFRVGAQVGMMF